LASHAPTPFFNDYDNNVSRITDNVLRRFRSPESLSPIPE
jgi:hypothetical protein|tara:strand:- start:2132 stop:2251 length:120 start_codon:yes stop_codon:yes gene_type:complete